MSLYSIFIEPFAYEFMRNALVISILAGTVAPLTGYWALSRRMVYLTDAMSHSVLPGVIIGTGTHDSNFSGVIPPLSFFGVFCAFAFKQKIQTAIKPKLIFFIKHLII